MKKIIAELTL